MVSEEKYTARLDKRVYNKIDFSKKYNYCLYQTEKIIEYLNLTVKQCQRCKSGYPNTYIRLTPNHIKQVHGVFMEPMEDLLTLGKQMTSGKKLQRMEKKYIKKQIKQYL